MLTPTTKNILLMTASGCYNLGDELITLAEVEYLFSRYPDVHITVSTYDSQSSLLPQDEKISFLFYFPSHMSRDGILRNLGYFCTFLSTLWHSDIVIIGGGGILYDNEKNQFGKLFWQWKIRVFFTRLFMKPLLYWSIGLEIEKTKHKRQLKSLFSTKDIISVRDDRSLGLMHSIERPAVLIHDAAFLLPPRSRLISSENRIGLSLRPGFLSESEEKVFQIFVSTLLTEGYTIVLIPHTLAGDDRVNDHLFYRRLFPDRSEQIREPESMQAILDIYPTLTALIGMRYHSGILAAAHGIPLLLIPYGPKVRELIQILGISTHLTPGSITDESLRDQWSRLLQDSQSIGSSLSTQYLRIHTEVRETLHTF